MKTAPKRHASRSTRCLAGGLAPHPPLVSVLVVCDVGIFGWRRQPPPRRKPASCRRNLVRRQATIRRGWRLRNGQIR